MLEDNNQKLLTWKRLILEDPLKLPLLDHLENLMRLKQEIGNKTKKVLLEEYTNKFMEQVMENQR